MRKYYEGLWRAEVIENDDSGEEHPYYATIKVRIPEIHGLKIPKEDLPWAYAMMPFGQGKDTDGFDYCSVNIPRVDTWVWVMFEHGDPNRPVYLGGWIGGEDSDLLEEYKTDERSEAMYPDIQGWKFGFADGSFSVRIIDDRRLEIYFDENNIIEIDTQGDEPNEEKQIAVRSEWLIRLKSDKEVRSEAPKIVIDASSELEVTSDGTAEIGGAGLTTVKGAGIYGQGTALGTFAHPRR